MRANREDLTDPVLGGVSAQWGAMEVSFRAFAAGFDARPLVRGLPDDLCPCPHWGYVLKGRMDLGIPGTTVIVTAGDAFYMPPGHVPVFLEDTEFFEVSPSNEMAVVQEVVERNLAALAGDRASDVDGE
jgi:hypothetical protein